MRIRHILIIALLFAEALALVRPARLAAQTVVGFRASRLLEHYPGGEFPAVTYWPAAAGELSGKFVDAVPGGVWIVSLYQGAGVTELQFPGADRRDILFTAADSSEPYLTMLDSAGARIWLQVEPGAADVDTLIDLVLNRYGHHPSVAGIGVDVEWYQTNTHPNGKQVTDAEAQSWEARVKAHNPNYTLFLKHWLVAKMPPSYRGSILFIDDSQDFPSLAAMTAEFSDWGAAFAPNQVGFQFGYPADSAWWRSYADPMRSIGDTLRRVVANAAALFWVDFTIDAIVPVPKTYYVTPAGSDLSPGTEAQPWKTVQHAATNATPGSTVLIKAGVYNEKIVVNVSGSAGAGPITFSRYVNDSAVLDGTGRSGDQIILVENKSFVTIAGLELRNNLNQSFGSGIWVQGWGNQIVLRENIIHDMRAAPGGGDAMGISIYGTDAAAALTNIVVEGNHIYDCEPGHSEALTLNGNVDTFRVVGNLVHDVDNIGIDMIGGEGTSPAPSKDAARNGLCAGNRVFNARSNYGGGYAAGIYVDGGRNIVVERNIVSQCDVGMEIGCENAGLTASGIIVRDNRIYNNDKAGLGFGGYNYPSTGKVAASSFTNNTVFANDVLGTGTGELWIQYAEQCTVKNNIFVAAPQNRLMTTTVGNAQANLLDHNLWFAPGGSGSATVDWNGTVYGDFAAYLSGTGQDPHSLFGDPLFVSSSLPSPDLDLQTSSPAIDAGDPFFVPGPGETDIGGNPRVVGARVDIGATEVVTIEPGAPSPPELLAAQPGDGTVTLRWTRNGESDFAKYVILGGITANSTARLDSTGLITDTTAILAGLTNGVAYFFRLAAMDIEGLTSGYSNELGATPSSASAPPKPQLIGVGREAGAFRIRWRKLADSASYHLQISAHPAFAAPILDGPSAPDTSALAAALQDSTVYFWRVRASNSAGAGPWSDAWNFFTADGNIAVECRNRWNLLSLPADVPDGRRSSLFPTAASPAFAFHEGYAVAETLEHGEGYWMKFSGAQEARFTGTPIVSDSIGVSAGWNLVGSLSAPVAALDAGQIGTTVTSLFFGYDGGYAPADSLLPGRGYWVKVDQDGMLALGSNAAMPVKRAWPGDELLRWSQLSITDAAGNSQTLYVAPVSASPSDPRWELPPPPPAGGFDARFASGHLVEELDGSEERRAVVELRSTAFPVKIRWKRNILGILAILDDGGSLGAEGSGVTVGRRSAEIGLTFSDRGREGIPAAFSLAQNYPNPFNGETRFEFSLPSPSRVRLAVYDVLGREIALLADEQLPSGRHARSWNARGAASGVYFCRLTDGAATRVRSLVLMK